MSVNLSPVAGAAAQFLDNNGNVLTGGKLFTYLAGTTTPAATYTSSAGAIFHSNPIILDAAGRVQSGGEIWLSDNIQYKFVLKDANDVLIASWDNLSGINSNFVNYTVQEEVQTATAGQTVFNLSTVTYAPGTNSLSVYVDGVNQYEGSTYSFVETNATTVTFTAGLHVGALVKFTTAVPATGTATNANVVTYDPAGTGAVPTTVEAKLRETVSVKDFGAVGDGVADDTAAIEAAIDFGGVISANNLTLRVTTAITKTITDDLVFDFVNSKIVYDGTPAIDYVLRLNVEGCRLSGSIQIDCDLKAHKGLYLSNNTDNDSTVFLSPKVQNVYKTLTTYTGEGLYADGLFSSFILNNPVFTNMVMASGAGTPGTSGIRGATIKALTGTRYPKYVEINAPEVYDVYSEDTSYTSDQDGIGVFSPEDASAAPNYDPFEQKAFVVGGVIKNCMGRGFKFQNQYAEVMGTHFERDMALAVAPWGVEVDFQTGGGSVSNATARYVNGSTPLTFSNFSTPQTAAFVVPYGSANNIKIFTDATSVACMREVVKLSNRTLTGTAKLFVSDVSVVGNIESVIGLNPFNGSGEFFASGTGMRAAPTVALVQSYGSSATDGEIAISNSYNLGSSTIPAYFRSTTSQLYKISAINIYGFADYKALSAANQGLTLRPHSIASSDQIVSAMLRPVAFTLADGASYALPQTALTNQTNMLIVTVNNNRNSQAIFSCDNTQVVSLASGSDWVVGTTTEPVSGNYRIWSGVSGQTISNRSGTSRTFTVLMFG